MNKLFRRPIAFAAITATLLSLSFKTTGENTAPAKAEAWTSLLDKDLSQWENYLSYAHKNGYDGKQPLDEKGEPLKPVGYNINKNHVFSVTEEQGEPVLRISGEIYGCVFTKKEYENYHLKLKVKWGSLKHEPRKDKLKDSGILYHSKGEAGVDYWRSWMLSQEFQVMEGHMGDYWNTGTSAIDIRAFLPEGQMNSVADARQGFLGFGTGEQQGFCLRSENNETPGNGWTSLELICYKGKSLHIVNGKVVMVLRNSRYVENGKSIPLTKGRIQLQSEGGEVYFKDIKIKEIDALPAQYNALFQ